jgi:hypothetical protein
LCKVRVAPFLRAKFRPPFASRTLNEFTAESSTDNEIGS